MSGQGASKTSGAVILLYAEGAGDPEADLVLVCGERKFFVRRAVCEMAFPVVFEPGQIQRRGVRHLRPDSETLDKIAFTCHDPR